MDRKTPKKRKAKKSKSNGRSEEKPKVSEVTTEKEEEDRLEAANVLSSLMFLAPKPSDTNEEDGVSTDPNCVKSTSLTQIVSEIPVRDQHVSQGRQSRGRGSQQIKTSLQNHSSKSKSDKIDSSAIRTAVTMSPRSVLEKIKYKQPKAHLSSNAPRTDERIPATITTDITVNKKVASALRQAVSNNLRGHVNSADQVELTQSSEQLTAVSNNIKNVDLPQRNEDNKVDAGIPYQKKGAHEMNLPLKKRRLIAIEGSNDIGLSGKVTFQMNLKLLKMVELYGQEEEAVEGLQ